MSRILKTTSPFLVIIFGLFLLFFMDKPMPAGVCILIGVVMIIERIWPEKWGIDDPNN